MTIKVASLARMVLSLPLLAVVNHAVRVIQAMTNTQNANHAPLVNSNLSQIVEFAVTVVLVNTQMQVPLLFVILVLLVGIRTNRVRHHVYTVHQVNIPVPLI